MKFAVAFAWFVFCAVQAAQAVTIFELQQEVRDSYDSLTSYIKDAQDSAYWNVNGTVQFVESVVIKQILDEINNGPENCRYLADDVNTWAVQFLQKFDDCQRSEYIQKMYEIYPAIQVLEYQVEDLLSRCTVPDNTCDIKINEINTNLHQIYVKISELYTSASKDVNACLLQNIQNGGEPTYILWQECVKKTQ